MAPAVHALKASCVFWNKVDSCCGIDQDLAKSQGKQRKDPYLQGDRGPGPSRTSLGAISAGCARVAHPLGVPTLELNPS
jgi:hypothetical protein